MNTVVVYRAGNTVTTFRSERVRRGGARFARNFFAPSDGNHIPLDAQSRARGRRHDRGPRAGARGRCAPDLGSMEPEADLRAVRRPRDGVRFRPRRRGVPPAVREVFGLPIVLDTDDASRDFWAPSTSAHVPAASMAMMTVESRPRPATRVASRVARRRRPHGRDGARPVVHRRRSRSSGSTCRCATSVPSPSDCAHAAYRRRRRRRLPVPTITGSHRARVRPRPRVRGRAFDAPNVGKDAVVLVHPPCAWATQEEDIPGTVRHGTSTSPTSTSETKDTPAGKRTSGRNAARCS